MLGSPIVEPNETAEAVLFLWVMTAISAGLVELVHVERGPGTQCITYRDNAGTVATVSRNRVWTQAEERRYAVELERILGRSSHAAAPETLTSENRATRPALHPPIAAATARNAWPLVATAQVRMAF